MEEDPNASRGASAVIVSCVSVGIAFIVLALRIITRMTLVRNIWPEDYVIIASLLFSIALTSLICVEFEHGQGRHIASISEPDLVVLFKAFWASVPIYQLSLTLTKLSILVQYWRVFVNAKVRWVIIALFAITSVYGLWSVFGTIFMCMPVSDFWNANLSESHCMDKYAVWFANAALNILTDVAIFVLPMPVLNDLRLPKRQRLALMAVFGLGAFVCLTSILRLKSLWVISNSTDITWDNGGAASWSSLEVNVGIICASLPTLRKTISRFFPRVFSSTSAGGSRSTKPHRSKRQRFPIAQESANWANVLQVPEDYGKSVARVKVGLDSRIESNGSTDSDTDSIFKNKESRTSGSGIKVVTVTTQEVVQIHKPAEEEGFELEDLDVAEMEEAHFRDMPGWNRRPQNYALQVPHGV